MSPGLGWETTTTLNAGLDFGFWRNRVTGSVDSIALSADRLTLYFSSRRSPSLGRSDIWSVTRASTTAPFGAPTQELLQGINSAEDDLVSWISPDNCRLYFSSFRGNGNQLFVATRTP